MALSSRLPVRQAMQGYPPHFSTYQVSSAELHLLGRAMGLTASPLPHHRTYGSRRRRFGRFSQGDDDTPSGASSPGVPAANSFQVPDIARQFAGYYLATPLRPTIPRYHSGLRHAPVYLLCPLLTAAVRSGRMAPPSGLDQDTPQISRGQAEYLLCLVASSIKHAPV
jgi:hypothetical protein